MTDKMMSLQTLLEFAPPLGEGTGILPGLPTTAIVRPPASIAARCAAVSIPTANPETTVKSRLTSSRASRVARLTPSLVAF